MFYSVPPYSNNIPVADIAGSLLRMGHQGDTWSSPLTACLGTDRHFVLSSGRAALWLILKALSRLSPEKGEVIIPAYTCPALVSVILKAGLRPVLTDINEDDFGFASGGIEKAMGTRTLAVIVVHLLGFPAALKDLRRLCSEKGVYLVEDGAQAFGNSTLEAPEERLGLHGDAGFFSFGRGKPLSLLHGGLALLGSAELFHAASDIYRGLPGPSRFSSLKYVLLLGSYLTFSAPRLYWIPERMPFLHLGETIFEPEFEIRRPLRLPGLILEKIMDLAAKERSVRIRHSRWYAEAFQDLGGIRRPPAGPFPFLRYPLLLEQEDRRDSLLAELKREGTGAALFYPRPLNELPGLREVLQDRGVYGNASDLAARLITLPVHGGVTARCRETIRSIVARNMNRTN